MKLLSRLTRLTNLLGHEATDQTNRSILLGDVATVMTSHAFCWEMELLFRSTMPYCWWNCFSYQKFVEKKSPATAFWNFFYANKLWLLELYPRPTIPHSWDRRFPNPHPNLGAAPLTPQTTFCSTLFAHLLFNCRITSYLLPIPSCWEMVLKTYHSAGLLVRPAILLGHEATVQTN